MQRLALATFRRFGAFALLVFGSSAVFGALLWASPGSTSVEGSESSYLGWLGSFWVGLMQGDLGLAYGRLPLFEYVRAGMVTSLEIIAGALFLSFSIGACLVLLMGERLSKLGRFGRGLVHTLSVLPVFLLGYLALVGGVPPEGGVHLLAAIIVLSLGDGMLSDVLLEMKTELDRLRSRDFVWAIRLRGGPVGLRLLPHIALPLAQLAASKMAFLIGGVLVLEMVLGIQGIGLIGYKAAVASPPEVRLLLTVTVVTTGLVAGSQLLVGLLRLGIDPRVRKERRNRRRESVAS